MASPEEKSPSSYEVRPSISAPVQRPTQPPPKPEKEENNFTGITKQPGVQIGKPPVNPKEEEERILPKVELTEVRKRKNGSIKVEEVLAPEKEKSSFEVPVDNTDSSKVEEILASEKEESSVVVPVDNTDSSKVEEILASEKEKSSVVVPVDNTGSSKVQENLAPEKEKSSVEVPVDNTGSSKVEDILVPEKEESSVETAGENTYSGLQNGESLYDNVENSSSDLQKEDRSLEKVILNTSKVVQEKSDESILPLEDKKQPELEQESNDLLEDKDSTKVSSSSLETSVEVLPELHTENASEINSDLQNSENTMGCVQSKKTSEQEPKSEVLKEETEPILENNLKNEENEKEKDASIEGSSDTTEINSEKELSIKISIPQVKIDEVDDNEHSNSFNVIPEEAIVEASSIEANSIVQPKVSDAISEASTITPNNSVVAEEVVSCATSTENEPREIQERITALEDNNNDLENKKKEGVSAESGLKVARAKDIEITKYEKDAASQELIMNALKSNEFLFGLDTDALRQSVIDAMYLKNVPSGCYVITEGEQGSEVYVSAKGSFDVIVGGRIVNTLGPGIVFGELAVLYHTKRNASILATTDSQVWVLSRKVFRKVMMKAAMQREEQNIRFLRSVPLLRNLEKSSLVKMADLLRPEYFNTGVDIVRQGDSGSTFYIISRGQAVVTITTDGESNVVNTLSVGDHFGEYALLNDEARKATVTSVAGTECLVLGRAPFMELLGSLAILRQSAEKIKASKPELDTEVKSEYSHIRRGDLSFRKTLGVGGFGRVELVSHKSETGTLWFALKCIKKVVIVEQQQEEHVFNEKNIMLACRSPFIARLYKTYRDKKFLYLLMEPCMGGDVWTLLQKHGHFPEPTAQFMTACVVEGLEYLHTRGIVYRDLKPENLMLDEKGYVKLVDFGFAKNIGNDNKTWTFAGTPEYLAPEIVRSKGHDRAADYWSLGIFIHELLAGRPPFRGRNQHETYNAILKGIDNVRFSGGFSKRAVMIIKMLCQTQPTSRLGYQVNGISDIKKHRWFIGFDWESLRATRTIAPIVPVLNGPDDTSNFERYPNDKDIPPDEESGWDIDF